MLESLENLLTDDDWTSAAHYMLSRSLLHGWRRAEEMQEAARTVAEAGIEPWMSEACARRQARTASFAADVQASGFEDLLDAILSRHYPSRSDRQGVNDA